ncbi:hypothetical protein K4X33_06860 [Brevibacterium casei]|nr:hypothetical protein K4X33_06860 [Brevibacterium casei]
MRARGIGSIAVIGLVRIVSGPVAVGWVRRGWGSPRRSSSSGPVVGHPGSRGSAGIVGHPGSGARSGSRAAVADTASALGSRTRSAAEPVTAVPVTATAARMVDPSRRGAQRSASAETHERTRPCGRIRSARPSREMRPSRANAAAAVVTSTRMTRSLAPSGRSSRTHRDTDDPSRASQVMAQSARRNMSNILDR